MRGVAPGRVNLIGDHTDYADGFVLPMPLSCTTIVEVVPGDAWRVRTDLDDGACAFGLDDTPRGTWVDYIVGPLRELRGHGLDLTPLDLTVASTVPAGAGVSSSAALEVAVIRAALAATDAKLDDPTVARLAHAAETGYCGLNCGIMDQMAVACGAPGHALFLDCRSERTEQIGIPEDFCFATVHSGEARRLAAGAYNERRAAVEDAARQLGHAALRDAALDEIARLTDAGLRARARHVVTENARVRAAVEALKAKDPARFGALMTESHASLRDDFEVSTPALDALVGAARDAGALGARLTGAGFGGCIVALVPPDAAESWWENVRGACPNARLIELTGS